jgi:two-component system chemotaxis response regulator CheY
MIVDDAGFIREMLKSLLTEAGHEVIGEAADGAEAVRLYSHIKPDFVTMDITMPFMDGIKATERIVTSHPSAKIIMYSARSDRNVVLKSVIAGAKDFIVKPFQKERLMESICKVLQ